MLKPYEANNVTAQRVPPAAALLKEIDARARSPMVLAGGLSPLLGILRAYIVETDARLQKLEGKNGGT